MTPLMLALALAPASAPRVHSYQAVAISPAGDRIASVEMVEADHGPARAGDPPHPAGSKAPSAQRGGAGHGAIVLRDARSGAIVGRYDPCLPCGYSGLSWSRDGRLAFLATDEKAATVTLDVAEGAGAPRAVATLKGIASTPRWSPDGRTLAVLATFGAQKASGATQAGVPQVGEIGEKTDEQRIAVVPVAGGALRPVTPDDTYVYEYDWTPDGRGFALTAAKGNGDDNWWIAKLEAVDLASGAMRVIAAPKLQMNFPRVSPDGRTVMFIGGIMSDFGSVGGDLYSVAFAGGEPIDLTPGFKGSFTSLSWKGGEPTATALIGDQAAILTREGGGAAPAHVAWRAPVSTSAADGRVSFSADGRMAATVAQDYEHAPHILAGPVSALAPVTHDNDGLPAYVSARSLAWRSDGFEVQGWLLAPRGAEPGVRHPLIVQVHGGPAAAATPGYVSRGTVKTLIDHGYYVFEPNPRGSYGQGEAFTHANVKDFGGGDLRDILAGVDAAVQAAPIDPQRVGITGVSYGGFMTMYAVTHTDRFKAGVAGAGVSDWFSYYGENGIHQWMLPFFGASAYDDPKLYAKLSPLDTVKRAKTPTFIWVGERDIECPPAQSVEMFNGLREMDVPTSLVIYAGEGHGVHEPDHVRDVSDRTLAWFDKYVGR